MNTKVKNIFSALALCFLITACAGQRIEDPALLERARAAAEAETAATRAWGARPQRARAAVTPESMALFPVMDGDMAMLGVYGNYQDGGTRFALTMPQGTRMGSCIRAAGGRVECRAVSSLALIGDLVRASFFALDEYFASAPGDAHEESWRLQRGDVHGGVSRNETVLVRRRALGWGSYANFIYDLSGLPLVFYGVSSQAVDWKLTFKNTGENAAYIFRDYRYEWIINVEILEVTP